MKTNISMITAVIVTKIQREFVSQLKDVLQESQAMLLHHAHNVRKDMDLLVVSAHNALD